MPVTHLQGSLFEEDYLLRTLGQLAHSAETALTELVANAWDAGAATVNITIPEEIEGILVVEDDGTGMTPDQFRRRWMTLGYDRIKHQGRDAEFPPGREDWRRPAYGRNGVGRHGLLCFADRYNVETKRDGAGGTFKISTTSGQDPFVLMSAEETATDGHGTQLSARVTRHLPDPESIRELLSGRFLHDPQFHLKVNGQSVELAQHKGLIDSKSLQVSDDVHVEAYFIDTQKAARTTLRQGVAFWVGQRLVGTPSWTIGERTVIDGRTQLAKRHTVVVRSNLFDEVLPDWSAFKRSPLVEKMREVVADYIEEKFRELAADRIQETQASVLRPHREQLSKLPTLAKIEVAEFVEEMTQRFPLVQSEALSHAVQAVIHLEQSRSGAALLEKLSRLEEEDIAGLDRLLSEWSVRDALTVLDEIDNRLAIVEALRKVSADKAIDELHTLHPLVTQARWLFGPEFDSPEYSSNESLRQAVQKVFKKRVAADSFNNPRKRPDLLILEDATLSAAATERIDDATGLARMQDILLLELKRGASKIGREDKNQASGYVEDLLHCGLLDGPPYIRAFVVGHEKDDRVIEVDRVGEPEQGRIQMATYLQLVRTAEKRLFRLRDRLERYDQVSGHDLLKRIFEEEPWQYSFEE